MEIIFNKLSFIENSRSSFEKKYLEDINIVINQGSIIGFVGDILDIIGKLLLVVKRPTKGEIKLGDVVIKKTTHIDNINELRKHIGFINTNSNKRFSEKTVQKEISNIMKNYDCKTNNVLKHIVDSLKIAGLNESYLERNPVELSEIEQKKVLLACVMSYNPEVIILDSFMRGMCFREKEYFRKLFLKLKNKYDKTIIVLGDNLSFLFDFVEKVYVINKGKMVLNGEKDIFYNDKLYKYVDMPKIVEFTKYAKEQGHNILEYTDIKELIKELYRNVG